ncbi:MAG: RNA polymerase sigma factor [Woeseiaceae bacterium]|nr:RNA polymerase sigma factor [Woeseiaceae bacterium]
MSANESGTAIAIDSHPNGLDASPIKRKTGGCASVNYAATTSSDILSTSLPREVSMVGQVSPSGYGQRSDEKLMDAVHIDDEVAYSVLFKRHWQYSVNFASRRLRNRDIAQELAQEAWMKVWKFRDRWDPQHPKRNFLAWFFRILRNVIVEYFRRMAKIPAPIDDSTGSQWNGPVGQILEIAENAVAQLQKRTGSRRHVLVQYYWHDHNTNRELPTSVVDELSKLLNGDVADIPSSTASNYIFEGLIDPKQTLKQVAGQTQLSVTTVFRIIQGYEDDL